MKRYSEYKDSGVEWIGEIPSHWEVKNWKHITDVLTDYTANGSFGDLAKNVQYLDHKDYARLVRLTDLRDGCKNEGIYVTEKAYKYLSKSKLNGGEFLIANVGAYSGLICEMPYLEEKATLGPNMMMAKFNKEIDNKFMIYVGNSSYSQMQLKDRSNSSSAQPKLNKDDFRSIVIVIPSLEEQKQIVKYLDKKTAQIETLISKKEELIETLKNSRTKLISETVTKGLDKDVPMKDSGVEWIGEIPSNWDIKNLGHISTMIVPMRDKPTSFDGDIPWIRIEDFDGKYIEKSKTEQNVSKQLVKKMNLKIYPKGTVLCSCSCNMGETAIVSSSIISNQTFIGIVPNSELISEYLYYLMISNKKRLDFLSSGAIQQYLSRTEFEHLKVQIPSIEEQVQIYKYLDEKTSKIDILVSTVEEQIELLKKAKQKLITEVVTGKIDVTNL